MSLLRLHICVWVSVLMVCPLVGHAVNKSERESLRGLKGVKILIEFLNDDVKAFGITEQQLRTDVEVKLRSAGIPVLSRSLDDSYLYINLTGIKVDSYTYVFSYSVEYAQTVLLERNFKWLTGVKIWRSRTLGKAGLERKQGVRETLKGLVDEFINDYLTVNPHSGPRPIPTSPTQRDFAIRAQEHLRALGYKPGPVDGILGGKSHQALRRYQAAKKLPVTGDLDDATKKAMGLK